MILINLNIRGLGGGGGGDEGMVFKSPCGKGGG